jgi:hypothetical protein
MERLALRVSALRRLSGRAGLVEKGHPQLIVREQHCRRLGIVRSTLDCQPAAESAKDRKIKCLMDESYLPDACRGPEGS